ncbi:MULTISPECIES: hypothetical protein [Streptomycetaceae]|uniref:hypothetical protein n=1 Tax=Streptomycetaceae TaxID=2062 RepID=UPI00093B762E|nr:hypothetical protein [Streptomyces sp. CB02056]OKI08805.1 hypothetical protein AMK13_10415 [Streptomyces sp. CB02056]
MPQRSNTGPTAAEIALDAAIPADMEVPALSADVLVAVHQLDLDALVPAAEWWRVATRRSARRLIRQMGSMLRHLVAEIVTLDRQLGDADAELDRLRAEVKELRTAAAPDVADPLVVAHGLALRLSQRLTPAPVSVSVDRYPYDPTPRVVVHADDVVSVEAWGADLGAEIRWRDSSTGQSRMGRGECTVDGIPVSITASVYLGRTATAVAS